MITEEIKNKNLLTFQKQLEKFEVPVEKLIENYGERIGNSPFFISTDSGLAYDGALVNFLLKVVTPYAVKLNDLLLEEMRVERSSLIKVCLLHQIAKSIMFIPNDNTWEIEKRGLNYKYSSSKVALKTGIRSLLLCQQNGIQFTEEEVEAMIILDRDVNDEQAKYFSSTLSILVKQANELALLENKFSKK